MKVKQTCAANIFANMHTVKVTTNDTVVTDNTYTTTDRCGNTTGITLSDTILIPKTTAIPAWVWDSRYVISINGLTYPVLTVNDIPYIKGLSFKPEFLKHISISLLYIPFMSGKVAMLPLLPELHPEQLTEITLATELPVNRVIVFLAGRLIDPTALISNGTHLIITPPPEVLDAITEPPDGIIYPTITTLQQLLSHPGTFIITTTADIVITHTPVGAISDNGVIYGAPNEYQSLGVGEKGEILPYRYTTNTTVLARYCTPKIHTWTTISTI